MSIEGPRHSDEEPDFGETQRDKEIDRDLSLELDHESVSSTAEGATVNAVHETLDRLSGLLDSYDNAPSEELLEQIRKEFKAAKSEFGEDLFEDEEGTHYYKLIEEIGRVTGD